MKAKVVRTGVAAINILADTDCLEVEDNNGNVIVVTALDNGAIELRGIGRLLTTPLAINPVASNIVVVSVGGTNLQCDARFDDKQVPGLVGSQCYLQRGHEGDHRVYTGQYRSWSSTHAPRT